MKKKQLPSSEDSVPEDVLAKKESEFPKKKLRSIEKGKNKAKESFKRKKRKQLPSSSENMTHEGTLAKKESKFPKKKLQSMKKRKYKNNAALRSSKFTLDTYGRSMSEPETAAQYKKMSKASEEDVLGYDSLAQKERDLAVDLFGDDGEFPGDKSGETGITDPPSAHVSLESPHEEVPQMIPDDPFDVHQQETKPAKKPVWVDDDDENIKVKDVVASMTKARGKRGVRETSDQQYQLTLQEKFKQVFSSTPEWAELDRKLKEESDEEDEMMRSTGNYLSKESSINLPKTRLEYKKLSNLNYASQSEGAVIKAVEFNPNLEVGLVAGFSNSSFGAATIFQVDGKRNHKIQSITFPKFPIRCAKFLKDGRRFVVGSNSFGYFYVYDMEAGKETKIPCIKTGERKSMKNFVVSPDGELIVFLGKKGLLHVFDTTALSHIDTLIAPEEVNAAAFNSNGSRMYTHGSGGDVFIWDMDSRVCVHKFYDDGCIDGTSMAISPSNQYLACGSSSGIVNVYDMADVTNSAPRPVKILDKLVTPVSALTFNSSSEILAMASDDMDNTMKLVHFPSMTYFTNFPGAQNNLRRVQVLNFSPKSGYLAAGSNNGTAPLYRLKHFSSY